MDLPHEHDGSRCVTSWFDVDDNTDYLLVNIGNGRLFGMEEDLGLTGSQFQIAVSVLFVTYCVSFGLSSYDLCLANMF